MITDMKKKKKKKGELMGMPKKERLIKAKEWIEKVDEDHIVKAYSKSSGLNPKNAMNELKRLGVKITPEDKQEVQQWVEKRKRHNERRKERRRRRKENEENKRLMMEYDSDETFAFIAGYTSGGAPFGITHEEMEEIERREGLERDEKGAIHSRE
ncbi:hypothetical protein J8TS2_17000 [Lederbergia ruris]|uniref:Uncharacterized protein n=2 Tax=Lederbergia ruris TaxID=217495 RepID=A0ABQ4KHF5_9BACI|nr:hypothetical protein J8TS2_17000 [Lederbergia ruris]